MPASGSPRVVHVEPFNDALDRSLMITRDIGGRPLTATNDDSCRAKVLSEACRDLAVINRQAVQGFGWVCRDTPAWPPTGELSDYAAFVVDDLPDPWPGRFADLFPADDLDFIEELIAKEQARDMPNAALAHGDLGLDHIFEHNGRYAGIIDFGEIRGTEPMFDLGVLWTQLPRENRATLFEAALDGYNSVSPLPDDAIRQVRVAGALKVLRQLGRWLDPNFDRDRDPASLAQGISRRLLPAVKVVS